MTHPTPTTAVREIRSQVRIDLTNAPTLTNTIGRTRHPHGLRITYGARTDITRIDLAVEWEDDAELWPPAAELPDWLRQIITDHMPADVDHPERDRPSGLTGLPIPFPAADETVPR
ncbi:hypothetical protein AB0I66_21445 [Streptomyces sp. NPDC050439]|uniref:hypothetical protein n=1 Tax=unclassified Streptomyces TaxID=2593676 RepID=UPI00343BBEBC